MQMDPKLVPYYQYVFDVSSHAEAAESVYQDNHVLKLVNIYNFN